MAGLLFKPFSIVLGLVTGKLAGALFTRVWGVIDNDNDISPHPMRRDVTTQRAVASAVVSASTFAATKTLVDRGGYRAFEYVLGVNARPKQARKEEKMAREAGGKL